MWLMMPLAGRVAARRFELALIVLAASFVLSVPAGAASTSNPATIGITKHTITIGQIATIGGSDPGEFQNANDSLDAFVAYVNSRGGVDGRTIKVLHRDDAGDCNTYTSALTALTGSAFATVGSFSVQDGCGQQVLTNDPTFPDIEGYVLNPTLDALPNVLSPSPQPPGYPTTGAVWLKKKFPSAITHTAALYPTYSSFIFNEESAAYKAEGFSYVYTRGFGATETNFTSDILRMKAEGVQIVDLSATGVNTVSNFVRQADQQDFHPLAVVAAAAYDANLFSDLGSAPADNMYMPLLYPMYLGQDSADNPALATYLHWLDRTHPGDSANIYGISAWASGVLFVQALKAAGPNPTRPSVLAALKHITQFSADGLLPSSDPGQNKAATCMVIVGVHGTHFVRLDPSKKGFECNGTDHRISLAQAASGA
jgi:ABC-type branched-subunit amino acid transport system substrate-binding protein